jgi:hypothetical protein
MIPSAMMKHQSWRPLWHMARHFGSQVPFVGSARSWLSDSDVPPERLALSNARRVVVKVGTAVVSNPDGTLALSRLGALVEQVKNVKCRLAAFVSPALATARESDNPVILSLASWQAPAVLILVLTSRADMGRSRS